MFSRDSQRSGEERVTGQQKDEFRITRHSPLTAFGGAFRAFMAISYDKFYDKQPEPHDAKPSPTASNSSRQRLDFDRLFDYIRLTIIYIVISSNSPSAANLAGQAHQPRTDERGRRKAQGGSPKLNVE
jgi:hypothetical protein